MNGRSPSASSDHSTYDVPLEVRWWDQDLLGHVNHVMIVGYLAEARTRWLHRDAVAQGVDAFAHPRIVVRLEIDYVSGVTAGRPLIVTMHGTRIGGGSFTVAYRGHQDGVTAFRASTVLVPTSGDGSTRKVSAQERDYLAGFAAASAAVAG
ncbi:acyl-CoA thioesterase [Nocardioides sp. JQ2195]|uniref:acyl-CoA thioesterase n=1 Tax=Nocardioides sp. JQ2195 TaxID=2592334 RepID=UPI00143EBFD5|nr:acyl-CoA thioesterase [Nocardioides sp. JQ2195]QIX25534.1 acyl-CoA thioesterase [Nocardioides sp. JQ2195]